MNKLKLIIFSCVLMGASLMALSPVDVSAQANTTSSSCQNSRFLTFPVWWRGLGTGEGCSINFGNDIEKTIIIIVTNVVEIILQVVGYACVAFIIVGGFYYMTSAGSPEQAARGLKTIRNAAIGLVISLMSVGIVNLVANGIGV